MAGQLAQLGLVVRVGQEAHVEREILLARRAVLEAEAHERQRQPAAASGAGRNSSAIFPRSIAADMPVVSITRSARLRSGSSSARSAATPGRDAALGRERMAAAGLLVARHERLLGGLEEQHVVGDAERVEIVHDRTQRLEVDAPAHVRDDRGALDLGALVHEQLDQRADHLRRQVVDAEVARVLEHVHRRRLARAGEARDHHEVLQARLDDGSPSASQA